MRRLGGRKALDFFTSSCTMQTDIQYIRLYSGNPAFNAAPVCSNTNKGNFHDGSCLFSFVLMNEPSGRNLFDPSRAHSY